MTDAISVISLVKIDLEMTRNNAELYFRWCDYSTEFVYTRRSKVRDDHIYLTKIATI